MLKKFSTLYLLVSLSLVFIGCNNDYAWKTTSDGVRVWVKEKSSDYEYRWEGNSLEGVAYGTGKLEILKKGDVVSSEYVRAYYGSFSPDSRKISANNDTIIGNLDDDGNITGFAVTVSPLGDVYIGNFENHKPDGYLAYRKNGVTLYRGNWKNGLRDGEAEECDYTLKCKQTAWNNDERKSGQNYSVKTDVGTYVGKITFEGNVPFANGYGEHITSQDTLEGFWEKNILMGPIVYKNKEIIYEGDLIDGKISGIGFFVDKQNNYLYSGGFIDGKPSGIGDYYNDNGDSYFGEWKNGVPNGYGKFKTSKYDYEGMWADGKINGEGVIRYANGDVYDGEFIDNRRFGRGQYKFKNGNEYNGEFIDGLFNGLGFYYYRDGCFYEGEFFKGKFHGDGTLYVLLDNDTIAITAHWSGNEKELPSVASILFSNGDLYEGELVNGMPAENGIWSTREERESLEIPALVDVSERDWIHRANDFYKRHKETWNHVVNIVNGMLLVVSVAQPELVEVTVPAMYGLNIFDGLIGSASACLDLYDSIEVSENISDELVNCGVNAGFTALIFFGPKVSSKAKSFAKPIAKSIMSKLSPSAKNVAKSILNIGKNGTKSSIKQAPKMISLVRGIGGSFIKKMETSTVGITMSRLVGKERHQFISSGRYREYIKKKGIKKLELGKDADGQVLKRNMYRCMNADEQKMLAKEKVLSPKGRGAQAHHVVAGSNPLSIKSRDILRKCKIDINDPRNGIFLPEHPRSIFKGSVHGNHIPEYDKEILERFETMVAKHGYSEKAAEQVLDDIKRDLYKGKIRLLRKYPKPNTTFSHWSEP